MDLISFKTAILAKEKGFAIKSNIAFDLQNNNKIINFKDLAITEFIEDCETGYRDKAFNYLKNSWKSVTDNTDEGYFLLAPTQSELQKWLRDHKLNVFVQWLDSNIFRYRIQVMDENSKIKGYTSSSYGSYEEQMEKGLYEALELIKQ